MLPYFMLIGPQVSLFMYVFTEIDFLVWCGKNVWPLKKFIPASYDIKAVPLSYGESIAITETKINIMTNVDFESIVYVFTVCI
jgi:hypothetical protein